MKRPCSDCPFRTDIADYLTRDRKREITRNVLRGDGIFHCHKTVDYDDADDGDGKVVSSSQWCTGALICMERALPSGASANQMVRISARLGLLDLEALDMDAPVASSIEEWIARSGD